MLFALSLATEMGLDQTIIPEEWYDTMQTFFSAMQTMADQPAEQELAAKPDEKDKSPAASQQPESTEVLPADGLDTAPAVATLPEPASDKVESDLQFHYGHHMFTAFGSAVTPSRNIHSRPPIPSTTTHVCSSRYCEYQLSFKFHTMGISYCNSAISLS